MPTGQRERLCDPGTPAPLDLIISHVFSGSLCGLRRAAEALQHAGVLCPLRQLLSWCVAGQIAYQLRRRGTAPPGASLVDASHCRDGISNAAHCTVRLIGRIV